MPESWVKRLLRYTVTLKGTFYRLVYQLLYNTSWIDKIGSRGGEMRKFNQIMALQGAMGSERGFKRDVRRPLELEKTGLSLLEDSALFMSKLLRLF